MYKFRSVFSNHWVAYLEKRSKDNSAGVVWESVSF